MLPQSASNDAVITTNTSNNIINNGCNNTQDLTKFFCTHMVVAPIHGSGNPSSNHSTSPQQPHHHRDLPQQQQSYKQDKSNNLTHFFQGIDNHKSVSLANSISLSPKPLVNYKSHDHSHPHHHRSYPQQSHTPIPACLDGVASGYDDKTSLATHLHSLQLSSQQLSTNLTHSTNNTQNQLPPYQQPSLGQNYLYSNQSFLTPNQMSDYNNMPYDMTMIVGNNDGSVDANQAFSYNLSNTIQSFLRYSNALQCSLGTVTGLTTNVFTVLQALYLFKTEIVSIFTAGSSPLPSQIQQTPLYPSITNTILSTLSAPLRYLFNLITHLTINPLFLLGKLILRTIDLIIRVLTLNVVSIISHKRNSSLQLPSRTIPRTTVQRLFSLLSSWCTLTCVVYLFYKTYHFCTEMEDNSAPAIVTNRITPTMLHHNQIVLDLPLILSSKGSQNKAQNTHHLTPIISPITFPPTIPHIQQTISETEPPQTASKSSQLPSSPTESVTVNVVGDTLSHSRLPRTISRNLSKIKNSSSNSSRLSNNTSSTRTPLCTNQRSIMGGNSLFGRKKLSEAPKRIYDPSTGDMIYVPHGQYNRSFAFNSIHNDPSGDGNRTTMNSNDVNEVIHLNE